MKKALLVSLLLLGPLGNPALADFGDADFAPGMFEGGPKSYHDAWCRKIKKECQIVFDGPFMSVKGQGGINVQQLKKYRYDEDGGEYYNYITYVSRSGDRKDALFLFAHRDAQREFIRAFARWKKQISDPIPNYRFPASQGPQETHGRDEGNNPYTQ